MGTCNYPLRFRSKHSGRVVEFESAHRGRMVYDNGSLSPASTWIPHTDKRKWLPVNTTKHRIMAKLGDYRGKA